MDTDQTSEKMLKPGEHSSSSPQGARISERPILSQSVNSQDHRQCAMLFRRYVSRTAAGNGRAVLEGVGLTHEVIEMCYKNSPQNEEEAIQSGLMKWRNGSGDSTTWTVLIEAMDYAQIGTQHIEAMKKELLKELPRKRRRPSTQSSEDLELQEPAAKKLLHDYTVLKRDHLVQDLSDLHSESDPEVIIKLLYGNALATISDLLEPHLKAVKKAAGRYHRLGLHHVAVGEDIIESADSIDSLMSRMSVGGMWDQTRFLRKAIASIPQSASDRDVAEAILFHYDQHLAIYKRATLLKDAIPKEPSTEEEARVPVERSELVPLKITSRKAFDGFSCEDCYKLQVQGLKRAFGIPEEKIICREVEDGHSTTVTFMIPRQYVRNVIQHSGRLDVVWILLELDIIEVSIPGVFTFIPSVGCFLSLLRGSKTLSADLLGMTEVLPYQTYCLLDPNTKEPLSGRPLSTKRIEQYWDSHGDLPDLHGSVPESGDIVILTTNSEDVVIPPNGSEIGATDELQSKVGELEDKVKDLERKVANLFMDNVALKTKLEASREVERQQYEEIACLKERLVQALKAQDTATQEQSLSRTRESQLKEEIKVLDKTISDLEAEVEKYEKQMKQLQILPSDMEQLVKPPIGALLLSKQSELTIPVQQKERTEEPLSGRPLSTKRIEQHWDSHGSNMGPMKNWNRNALDALRGELAVLSKASNVEQMGELISILLGKSDADFGTFCVMLRDVGYAVWAYELEKKAEWFKQTSVAETITIKRGGAVHINPLKPRNRGQETVPWKEIETIANATVFIKGWSRSEKGALVPHAGTGTLICHAGGLWLLTANSVLNNKTSLDMFSVHFGYIDENQPGDSLKASELIKADKWHSLGKEGFNYSFVPVHEDKLQIVLKKLPVPIYWDVVDIFSQQLERYDHLYTVHYPDPEHKGEHRRCFGGDIIMGTQGALIFCSMSTWDGSDGAPLFMTDEKSCKPQLVGIYNYSRKHPRKGAGEDVALTNIGCKIHHIKGHVATGQWSKKDVPDTITVKLFI